MMSEPNWTLVAANYEACLEATEAGRAFSLCFTHDGAYRRVWEDMWEEDYYDEDFYEDYL